MRTGTVVECAACGHRNDADERARCIHRKTLACPVSGWSPDREYDVLPPAEGAIA